MKSYYVYEHWLDNQCFYVGKGTYGSLWGGKERYEQFQDDRRNKEWKDFVDGKYNEIKIRIVKNFDNEKDAENYEENLSIKRKKQGYPVKCKINGRNVSGTNNPMSGKNAFENKSDEEIKEINKRKSDKMKGRQCIKNRKKVVLVDSSNNLIKTFDTVHEALTGNWRKKFPRPYSAEKTHQSLHRGTSFHGFYLKYEDNYLEELKNGKNI